MCGYVCRKCSVGLVIPARSWRTIPTMSFPFHLCQMLRAGHGNANSKSGLRKMRKRQVDMSIFAHTLLGKVLVVLVENTGILVYVTKTVRR